MSIARTLRRIEGDLTALLAEPTIDRDAITLAARRIGAQAEMIELGLDQVEPRQ